jgi:hypothetical protein
MNFQKKIKKNVCLLLQHMHNRHHKVISVYGNTLGVDKQTSQYSLTLNKCRLAVFKQVLTP